MSELSWDEVKQRYPVGCGLEGTIDAILPFGMWFKFDFSYKGLLLIPDSGIIPGQALEEVFSVGESLVTKVIHHSDERQHLVLSRKA